MIKLQVIGNLGKDCVTNSVNGKTVMNFAVAHTEKFKDAQGSQREKTTWVDCAYWSEKTGVAPYLKKGVQVYVDGAPELKSYQKNDGTTGTSLSLRVNSVQLLGAPKGEYAMAGESSQPNSNLQGTSVSEPNDMVGGTDDLPF